MPSLLCHHQILAQKKSASLKADNQVQKKLFYTGIIAKSLSLVKATFEHIRICLKGKRKLSLADVKLLESLARKHQGQMSATWQEFYDITGTNFKTFNY